MDEEVPLAGGALTGGVVRVGDTVRRPPGPRSELMREVLVRLEHAGFDGAPRWLGVDGLGRDVLTWIDGETFADRGRLHPYLAGADRGVFFGEDQLAAAMRLLRRYHDAFAGDLICHGDYGPWNIVWRDELPVALIDFDNVHRGAPGDDVAYALRTFLGYGLASADPHELVRRTAAALRAYGADFDVPDILAREYERAEERCRRNGWRRQLAKLPGERAWLAAHAALF